MSTTSWNQILEALFWMLITGVALWIVLRPRR